MFFCNLLCCGIVAENKLTDYYRVFQKKIAQSLLRTTVSQLYITESRGFQQNVQK